MLKMPERKRKDMIDKKRPPHPNAVLLSELSPLRENCNNNKDCKKSTTPTDKPATPLSSNDVAAGESLATSPLNVSWSSMTHVAVGEGIATKTQYEVAATKEQDPSAARRLELATLQARSKIPTNFQRKSQSPFKEIKLGPAVSSEYQATPTRPPLAKSTRDSMTRAAAGDGHPPGSVRSICTAVDLDITVDFSTNSSVAKESFISIIENTMESVQFDNESQLAKLWAAVSDEQKDFSMEDALTASVTDLLNLQSQLHKTERELVSYKAFAALPSKEEKYQKQIKALQTDLAASRKIIATQNAQKQRMICNMKKKTAAIAGMKKSLEAYEKDLCNLTLENGELRRGLETVCETRDSYKNRLRCQEDRAKETHLTIHDLQKSLRRMREFRALETELLDHFRKLSVHTGYYRWGKPIRAVEEKLKKLTAAEEACGEESI